MATHDYVIANASGAAVRADLNNALAAIVSNNSNATEPATTYPYMWWADTTNGLLKQRNAANDDWITIREIDSDRLLVGTSSWSGNNSILVCAGNTLNASGVGLITVAREDVSANLSLNDQIGRFSFTDLNGAEFARITCSADATPGATDDYPGRLEFYTTADGAASPTERWQINSGGTLVSLGGNIDNAATYTATTANSANMYVGSGGVYQRSTSSIKYKTDVETLQDKYADAVLECRPVWYRSTCENDCAEHSWWGFIAEEVAEIDPRLVHWKTTESTIQEDGRLVKTPCNPEPDGVAYDRFVPHLLNLIKRQQQAIETLEAKVAALEAN